MRFCMSRIIRQTASSLLTSFLPFQATLGFSRTEDSMPEDTRYDIIVFGATGFTGAYVVEEMARVAVRNRGLRWAVSGRNDAKLQATLSATAELTGIPEVQKTPRIIADTSNLASLTAMAEQGKVVLNCVGPYRFFGEAVVQACLEAGANYVDISGEPQFLETMQLKYNAAAAERGIYIVGACGFDSVPAEMGLRYTEEQFHGDLNGVQCFVNITPGPEGSKGNFGTWQSAVHGFAHRKELVEIRKKLFTSRLPKPEHRLKARYPISYCREIGSWCLPFPGSDRSVVNRTQRHRYQTDDVRPIQFHTYLQQPSLLLCFGVIMIAAIFGLLANFRWGRYLLERFPGFFSVGFFGRGGPTRAQVNSCSFTLTFIGEGWDKKQPVQRNPPRKRIITCVSGPEPGYIATPICMIQSALTILQEKTSLPASGGVFTPGAAFEKTRLIQRLQENRIVFMVIKS